MDTDIIATRIAQRGAFFDHDRDTGDRVEMFAHKGYPFKTEDGLRFLQKTLEDKRIQSVVESFFSLSGLGMFKVFGPHPDIGRALLNRISNELLALTVFLCRDRSRLVLFEGSEKKELGAKPGRTGLLELSWKELDQPGIVPQEIFLERGGLVIADGRLFSTVLEGVVIAVGFADEKELKEWGKMPLPWSTLAEQMIKSMESERIKLNFKFLRADAAERSHP